MFVSMWMTTNPVTVLPTTPLTEVATMMARSKMRRFPVVASKDPAPKVVGILTASDILHAFPPELNPFSVAAADTLAEQTQSGRQMPVTAADIMSSDPRTIVPEAPIEEAARLMRDHKISVLPVVKDGVLQGIITQSDIFRALVSIFESAGPGAARITFDISQSEDVFPLIADIAKRRDLRVVTFVSLQKQERPLCVVEVTGKNVEKMLDDVWKSHHRVMSVIRLQ
jgi:acetoin utilization protein AcuB